MITADRASRLLQKTRELQRANNRIIRKEITFELEALGLPTTEKEMKANYPDIVYFIGANGLIKIGQTRNLIQRLYNFKITFPCKVKLLAIIPTESHGLSLERYFHEGFADSRFKAEWFRKSDSLTALVDIFGELSYLPPMPVTIHAQPKPQHQSPDRKPEPEPEPKPEMLTIDGAAAYLRLTVNTLRKMLIRGELPAQKIDNEWRFPKQQLLEWIEGKPVRLAIYHQEENDHEQDADTL